MPHHAAPAGAPRSSTPTAAPPPLSDRIWTVPNVISFLRLLGVPLFLWLALGPHDDGFAVLVLMVSGFSDYLDGKLARLLGQSSRLGQLLDPAADRLYIVATIATFAVRHIIPWWLTAALVGREVVLGLSLPVLRRYGYGPPPVHYLGKAATLCLLYAFPLLLLGGPSGWGELAKVVGWAFTLWGTGLYWWAGLLYLGQMRDLVRAARAADAAERYGQRRLVHEGSGGPGATT